MFSKARNKLKYTSKLSNKQYLSSKNIQFDLNSLSGSFLLHSQLSKILAKLSISLLGLNFSKSLHEMLLFKEIPDCVNAKIPQLLDMLFRIQIRISFPFLCRFHRGKFRSSNVQFRRSYFFKDQIALLFEFFRIASPLKQDCHCSNDLWLKNALCINI